MRSPRVRFARYLWQPAQRAHRSDGFLWNGQSHPHVLIAIERRCETLSICFVVTIRRRTSLNSYVCPARDGARPESFVRPDISVHPRLLLG